MDLIPDQYHKHPKFKHDYLDNAMMHAVFGKEEQTCGESAPACRGALLSLQAVHDALERRDTPHHPSVTEEHLDNVGALLGVKRGVRKALQRLANETGTSGPYCEKLKESKLKFLSCGTEHITGDERMKITKSAGLQLGNIAMNGDCAFLAMMAGHEITFEEAARPKSATKLKVRLCN